MMLDDDPLFSEWSRSPPPAPAETHRGATHVPTSIAPYELDFEDEDPFPQVPPERRARLQRYVRMTVAGCVVLCMAAATRVGISRATAANEDAAFAAAYEAEISRRESMVANEPPPANMDAAVLAEVASPPPPSPPPAALPAPPTPPSPVASAEPAPAPPTPAAPVATAAPVPAAPVRASAPSATTLAATTSPPPSAHAAPAPRTAAQERESARHALEHGKLRDAAVASEHAAALDPSDAEAWLILGAAKQELGQGAAARAAFQSCAKSAKRGPVSECRAMLR